MKANMSSGQADFKYLKQMKSFFFCAQILYLVYKDFGDWYIRLIQNFVGLDILRSNKL